MFIHIQGGQYKILAQLAKFSFAPEFREMPTSQNRKDIERDSVSGKYFQTKIEFDRIVCFN